jgi:hypothetical protein
MPNILVRDAAGSLLTMKTVELAGVHTPYQVVGSIEKKFRDSFPGPSLDSAKWDNSIGAGGSITFSGGAIVIASGTTINSDTSITTKETFQIPFRVSFNAVLSQRIINQSFIVEAISVNSTTGVPDGQHTCAWVFDGTTATQAKYRVQNSALTPLDSAASTVPTTASAGLYELEPFADECWFHGGTLDATTGRANSYRRHQQIPDPNGTYKIRVRWLNGATAPATTTTASLQFVAIQDYQELTAEITAGRGQSVAGQAIAAAVVSMPTVYANSMDNQFWNDSVVAQAISATVTGTARDIGVAAGGVHRYSKFNASAVADQAGTLRIECSNDNITWRRATADTAVAANTCVHLSVPIMTRFYRAVYVNGGVAQTAFMLNTSFTAA